MSISPSPSNLCFNPECKELKSEPPKRGWRLRTADFAELCDGCATAYVEGRFCQTFHVKALGWRCCESCGKRIHCGCIVSAYSFQLLDAGGIECVTCARKNVTSGPNPSSSPLFVQPLVSERLKPFSIQNWSQLGGSSPGQYWQASSLFSSSISQSDLLCRSPCEYGLSTTTEISSGPPLEKRKIEAFSERLMKLGKRDVVENGSAGSNVEDQAIPSSNRSQQAYSFREDLSAPESTFSVPYLSSIEKKGDARVPETPLRLTTRNLPAKQSYGESDHQANPSNGNQIRRGRPRAASRAKGSNGEEQATPCLNKSQQAYSFREDLSSPQHAFSVPYTSPVERNGGTRLPESPLCLTTRDLPAKQSHGRSPNEANPSNGKPIRKGRPRADSHTKGQILPQYQPRFTDQDLRCLSTDSNSVVTPLFEKMLSASDAGRIGRLVLPKKCAEAYLPPISSAEGLPLRVQDSKGMEWVFQFRFWPNNNSRMYVLEGITPCIQHMQLQAGDIVTFSRLDPEGKLIIGFRKASSSQSSDQDNEIANGASTNGVDKSGYIANETPATKSLSRKKKKSTTIGSKTNHIKNEKEVVNLLWTRGQYFLRPASSHVPVEIDGTEFDTFEDEPVFGKPTIFATNDMGEGIQWVQCDDCSKWRKVPGNALLLFKWTCACNTWDLERSVCSAAQELTDKQLEDLLPPSALAASQRRNRDTEVIKDDAAVVEVIEDLANGIPDVETPLSQTTTKHPRHKPGCSCIVCIQPPSGKGLNHHPDCSCNVCETMQRRHRTLRIRREKKQSEQEEFPFTKQQQQFAEETDNTRPNPENIPTGSSDDDLDRNKSHKKQKHQFVDDMDNCSPNLEKILGDDSDYDLNKNKSLKKQTQQFMENTDNCSSNPVKISSDSSGEDLIRNNFSTLKVHIDLNICPEGEEESSPGSID